MQYLNFDVDLIVTNEYGKFFIIPPFALQIFIHNVRNFKLIQHLHKNLTHYKFDPLTIPTLGC
jgi:hypothetical protein